MVTEEEPAGLREVKKGAKKGDEERKWPSSIPFTVIRKLDWRRSEERVLGDLVVNRSDSLDVNDGK